jgi:hypothetical protein
MSQLLDQRTTARLEAIPATRGPLVLGAATRVLPATPAAGPKLRVSFFEQISINVYTFAGNFQWQSLMAIVIPSLVVKFLGGANKDINLAMVVIWGTLVGFVNCCALCPTTSAIPRSSCSQSCTSFWERWSFGRSGKSIVNRRSIA